MKPQCVTNNALISCLRNKHVLPHLLKCMVSDKWNNHVYLSACKYAIDRILRGLHDGNDKTSFARAYNIFNKMINFERTTYKKSNILYYLIKMLAPHYSRLANYSTSLLTKLSYHIINNILLQYPHIIAEDVNLYILLKDNMIIGE
ncbi:ORF109 protein [Operophtera brumata nucleopolyhedrovirus]|uniref:ORF109 protein n=1 Tax=Operophtera brumata nucleopolyhedrovirus TaxID=1046267 RepID=A0A2H4UZY1_9ABAC|nr:ORF109 protein [Operophtera brumata nucleopolyhedrovirus]AUA60340.1 ORF109 protein [Operophtera brumata nucleopolyhedrovirus]